jgi:hypothetical protein
MPQWVSGSTYQYRAGSYTRGMDGEISPYPLYTYHFGEKITSFVIYKTTMLH